MLARRTFKNVIDMEMQEETQTGKFWLKIKLEHKHSNL